MLPMLLLNVYAQETLLLGLDMCHQAIQGFILFKNNIEVPWSICETHRQHLASDTVGHGMLETDLQTYLTCVLVAFSQHGTCYLINSWPFLERHVLGLT